VPRKSPYTIELSQQEREILQAQARRYTLPYREVVRAKIVLMAAAGLDNDQIAQRLDTRREVVSKWRKRFYQQRLEKTSIQCRCRCHPTLPAGATRTMRVEHEYERGGALAYLACWDVHRAKLFGRLEPTTGIAPFGRLVEQVMRQEPYRSARRVFWVVDNGSSHRGMASVRRLAQQWPRAHLVHTPVHSSWLNQVEIYLSIVQRKCLTPNDFASLAAIEERLLGFQRRYEQAAKPFEWKFTRADLAQLLRRLGAKADLLPAA
jgi:DDE superfamily endonuclease